MHQERVIKMFGRIYQRVGETQWPAFIADLRKCTNQDDPNVILLKDFVSTLRKYAIKLSERHQDEVRFAFPRGQTDLEDRINIGMMFEQRFITLKQKMYDKVNVYEKGQDVAEDPAGYTGQFVRVKQVLEPISTKEFLQCFISDNRMLQISNKIRQIDKDRNGYVTTQEIYDILREVYSVRLAKADLSKIVKPFASIQNPILVDYGSWRDWVLQTVENHEMQ